MRGIRRVVASLRENIVSSFVVLAVASLPLSAAAQNCRETIVASTPDANFKVNDDGTATHLTTGLTWLRCSLGQGWEAGACKGTAATYSWEEALRAAKAHRFAGHSDWRLPSKNEMESIVEERCAAPAVNSKVFLDTPAAYFWTSSPYAGVGHGAWSVDFGFGAVNASLKSGSLHVRLVRGGP